MILLFKICESYSELINTLYLRWVIYIALVIFSISFFSINTIKYLRYKSDNNDEQKGNKRKLFKKFLISVGSLFVIIILDLIFQVPGFKNYGYLKCWNIAKSKESINIIEKKVVFNANGGFLNQKNSKVSCYSKNSCTITSNSIPAVENEGYYLAGWSINDKTCKFIIADDSLEISDNSIFYACWNSIENVEKESTEEITDESINENEEIVIEEPVDIIENNNDEQNEIVDYSNEQISDNNIQNQIRNNEISCILNCKNTGKDTNDCKKQCFNTKTPNTIYVGDSRTTGLCSKVSLTSTEQCVAQNSMAIDWFNNTAVAKINGILKSNPSKIYNIVINLGVNKLYNGDASSYAEAYNQLKNGLWNKHNVFVVSVDPLDETKYTRSTVATNVKISVFNNSLQNHIDHKIVYCNTYDTVYKLIYPNNTKVSDKTVTDSLGLHYTNKTYNKIYLELKKCIYN